jgi:hypothetical protein
VPVAYSVRSQPRCATRAQNDSENVLEYSRLGVRICVYIGHSGLTLINRVRNKIDDAVCACRASLRQNQLTQAVANSIILQTRRVSSNMPPIASLQRPTGYPARRAERRAEQSTRWPLLSTMAALRIKMAYFQRTRNANKRSFLVRVGHSIPNQSRR